MDRIWHATIPVDALSVDDQEEMLQLMETYYLGVTREQFNSDLDEKDRVIMLRQDSSQGRVVGFSTLMCLDLQVGGEPVKAVFSGDTIVDRRSRCTLGLGLECAKYFVQLMAEHPGCDLFYVLTAKGWQTCRIPGLLFRQYSPSPDQPVNYRHQQVMEAFGARKYPGRYQPTTGLITYSGEAQRLRPGSPEGSIPPRDNPLVDLFVEKNPNYLQGDDLVYVAQIADWNFTGAFKKLLTSLKEPGKEPGLVG
jgi:hypothetical protein